MNIALRDEPRLFIQELDYQTRENIMNFDQKIKGIQAEINAKIKNSALYLGDNHKEYHEVLNSVAYEVDKAVKNIEHFINLRCTEFELQQMFQNEEIRNFGKLLTKQLTKLTKIKNKVL